MRVQERSNLVELTVEGVDIGTVLIGGIKLSGVRRGVADRQPRERGPAICWTTTAWENPPRHAEIEPSRLSKMKAALPLPPPLLTWKSVLIVVTPGAAVLTCPVGPFASLGGCCPD